MSAKAIREATGKRLLNGALGAVAAPCRFAAVLHDTCWNQLVRENSWLLTEVGAEVMRRELHDTVICITL